MPLPGTRGTAVPSPILEIRGLRTTLPGEDRPLTLVDRVSLDVPAGGTLAVVGESGSGKTVTFMSALGLMPPPVRVEGEVIVDGQPLHLLRPEDRRALRGSGISMVFQDPLTALNPVFTIGEQIVEVIRAHRPVGRRAARQMALEVLARVQMPEPGRRIDNYPHQLSGGMRQRALIAMAIVLGPKVLIADEPTTALDVTVQAQLLDLLARLQRESGMALVLITHDLGLVARYADAVAVMYAGRIVERGTVGEVFARPLHPYTRALFRSVPRLDGDPTKALPVVEGQPPAPALDRHGCAFEPRCTLGHGRAECRASAPVLAACDGRGHLSACHHWALLHETADREGDPSLREAADGAR